MTDDKIRWEVITVQDYGMSLGSIADQERAEAERDALLTPEERIAKKAYWRGHIDGWKQGFDGQSQIAEQMNGVTRKELARVQRAYARILPVAQAIVDYLEAQPDNEDDEHDERRALLEEWELVTRAP